MIRPLASAAVIGCAAALVADLLLQLALAAVRLEGFGYWPVPTLLERGRWIVAAALVWVVAPHVPLDSSPGLSMTRSAALLCVGRFMVALPLAWAAATIILLVVRLTLDREWVYDSRWFLTSNLYWTLIVTYAPWALGGVALVALSRHTDPS